MRQPLLLALVLAAAVPAAAEQPLKVAIGLSLPPYVIQEKNMGMEYDVAKEALALAGYRLEPMYLPLVRVPWAFNHGKVDAALTVNENLGLKAAYSEPYITYQNVAVSLKKNGFSIERIADLAGYSVVAFQNATLYLGPEFQKMAQLNADYTEYPEQIRQNKDLYAERIQVVVADKNIFTYYSRLLSERGVDTSAPVTLHHIFPPNPYKAVFRDPAVRDAFNRALAELKTSGRYQAIQKRYQ